MRRLPYQLRKKEILQRRMKKKIFRYIGRKYMLYRSKAG